MGEKRKGNPNWYEVRHPNGRISYRKKYRTPAGHTICRVGLRSPCRMRPLCGILRHTM